MPRRNPPKDQDPAAPERRTLPPPSASAITVLRAVFDLSQKELTDDLGVTQGVVSGLEAGRRPLMPARKEAILRFFSATPEIYAETEAFVLSVRARVRALCEAPNGDQLARLRTEAVIRKIEAAAGSFARLFITEVDLETARLEAARLWDELERLPPERRRPMVKKGTRYRKWALVELLCQKSLDVAGDSAADAMEIANLAVLVADHVPGLPAWRFRLQGYARAHLANAWRVHGKLPEAEQEFARAKKLWADGVDERNVLNEARVLHLEASLLIETGQTCEALHVLGLAQAADTGTEKNKLDLTRARAQALREDYPGAIETLSIVAPLISEEHEPRLLWIAQFYLVGCLLHLEQSDNAQRLLPALHRLTRRLGQRLDGLRYRWLEGRLANALGQKERALVLLSQVRDEFAELGLPFDTALATLELTTLFLEQGRSGDVLRLARQLEQIFRAQGAHQKALEAVLTYRKAAEQQALTVRMVRRLITYFERARYIPSLRYEAEEQDSPSPGRA
ncbi:MAG TPA: hypothetical protein DD490_03225 [Acidobacteria bacterium]|nr:hypothetical protein [Acidobacteriota bacterium]